MASIIKRNNNFCVVYSYKDANGTPKQKWETFTDLSDAKNRKKEVEYKESVGTFVVPQCKTLNDLLPEYVALYGKSKWALSTYGSPQNTARYALSENAKQHWLHLRPGGIGRFVHLTSFTRL